MIAILYRQQEKWENEDWLCLMSHEVSLGHETKVYASKNY